MNMTRALCACLLLTSLACGDELDGDPLPEGSVGCSLEGPATPDGLLAWARPIGGIVGTHAESFVYADGRTRIAERDGTETTSQGTAAGIEALQAELRTSALLQAASGCYGLGEVSAGPDADLYHRVYVDEGGVWLGFGGNSIAPTGLVAVSNVIQDFARNPH